MLTYSYEGKVVVVTGATRGIGKEVALAFADAGADLTIFSRKQETLDEVQSEITLKGRKCLTVCGNMGKKEDIEILVKRTIEEYGRIDVLINNAAANPIFGPVINVEEWAWDKIMDVNVKGNFFLSLEVGKIMIKQKSGNIINVVSTAGIRPIMGLGIYSISKAGLIMLTKVLAKEWAISGVRINAVAPGLVKTHFSRALWDNEQIMKQVTTLNPMKRIAVAKEIVGAILFLASDSASYINGEVLVIDGGEVG